MAKLHLEFYKGQDNYSDGDAIELAIEKIVTENRVQKALCDANISFPILYHLSPVRENIIQWYPFETESTVLEVGAGMGAITGALCRCCKKVSSVDLSKRRASINYARHKNLDNLDIFVGNMHDISFEANFDYVVVNGVLEYAGLFTKGDDPFCDFLRFLKGFLKEDGKLLLSIENRLGLKYFAGSPEDHTGVWFDGLQDYPNINGVKTFSHSELQALLEGAGFVHQQFFYPFPDYKFPVEIYSDESLSRLEQEKQFFNLDTIRYSFFNETKVRSILAREGVLSSFANSFFVEASMSKPHKKLPYYAKLSVERKEALQIITLLQEEEDKKRVAIKRALHDSGLAHLKKINEYAQKMKGTGFQTLQGELSENSLTFPFLQDKTLFSLAGELVQRNDAEALQEAFRRFFQTVLPDSAAFSSALSAEFEAVFGDKGTTTEYLCVKPANIDLIADNVFLQQDGSYTIIDSEWVFDFPVPISFIIWRCLHELYSHLPHLPVLLPKITWYQEYGISAEMENKFATWMNTFLANCSLGQTPVWVFEKEPFVAGFGDSQLQAFGNLSSTLYFDDGQGLSEQKKSNAQPQLSQGMFKLHFYLPKDSLIHELYWDPLERNICRCHIQNAYDQDGKTLSFVAHNAAGNEDFADGTPGDLFLTDDPRYRLESVPENLTEVFLEGRLEILPLSVLCQKREEEHAQLLFERRNIFYKLAYKILHRTRS